jgi:hypothetical protein
MIEIFIPVLFVCMNRSCEFMQQHTHYTNEVLCRQQIESQIEQLRGMATQGGGRIDIIEGTCIIAKVKIIKGIEA